MVVSGLTCSLCSSLPDSWFSFLPCCLCPPVATFIGQEEAKATPDSMILRAHPPIGRGDPPPAPCNNHTSYNRGLMGQPGSHVHLLVNHSGQGHYTQPDRQACVTTQLCSQGSAASMADGASGWGSDSLQCKEALGRNSKTILHCGTSKSLGPDGCGFKS